MATQQVRLDSLEGLNAEQRAAVEHGRGPLLVVAGAGTGKTRTLVHRTAHLIAQGTPPQRVLLLTFTRRAAAEMLRRVDQLLRRNGGSGGLRSDPAKRVWGGTFHATATHLLRLYGQLIGLDPAFTILDRGDTEDLLDVVRTELNLAKTEARFPKKGTCLAIYSACVNARRPIAEVIQDQFPWCEPWVDELKKLFQAFADRKDRAALLDYDDLLLFWSGLMRDATAGPLVRERFDCVLVDEYQDTNRLQAEIIAGLSPSGEGLTVVGDDAQSIYAFRAATVRNILDFPQQFPGTTVVKLEQNYRSTPEVVAVSNRVIAEAKERHEKQLRSTRDPGSHPQLVSCHDEDEQADFVVRTVLANRESGLRLKDQAVLFRASHHSMLLEAELARRNIPFVKYGGLKFLETAHVKDLMAFLRLAENPRDLVAGSRVLLLLPSIGPQRARQLLDELLEQGGQFARWEDSSIPRHCPRWPAFVRLMTTLQEARATAIAAQISLVRDFYSPLLEEKYDQPEPRLRDLEQLEQVALRFSSRQEWLADFALDPPSSTEDFAGEPLLDEDYLILSTIHSAKGLEWRAVFTIHAADGNIPSDMSTGKPEQIEEERRLFYVALTRARDHLYICWPLRYYHAHRGPKASQYGFAQLSRFITEPVKRQLQSVSACLPQSETPHSAAARSNVRESLKSLWS
jgi:DNA helicase-2/ATP-dependent DNA helicase PcrA